MHTKSRNHKIHLIITDDVTR